MKTLEHLSDLIDWSFLKDDHIEVITHGSCPDGMASAMIFEYVLNLGSDFKYFGDHTVTFTRYKDTHLQKPRKGCIFVDISPPEDCADEWLKQGAIVLDHHKEAKDVVMKFQEAGQGIFADEKENPGVSGALLAFWASQSICTQHYLSGSSLEYAADFALLAGIRDTWKKDNTLWQDSCDQASALMFFDWEVLRGFPFLSYSQLEMGTLLNKKRLAKARKLAEQFITQEIVVFMNGNVDLTSDVAEALRNQGSDALMLCAWKITHDNQVYCTLRTIKDGFDVGALAKLMGGGGHTNAAGFTIEPTTNSLHESYMDVAAATLEHVQYLAIQANIDTLSTNKLDDAVDMAEQLLGITLAGPQLKRSNNDDKTF